jgi:diacylglycerol kinase family enzyme
MAPPPVQPAAAARRVVISVNPNAGARSSQNRVEPLGRLLYQAGYSPEILTDLDEVGERATEAFHRGELRTLVAVGGDGTAAEMVNRTPPGVPLTLLPSGNENLLARYLGLGAGPEEVFRTIAEGDTIRLDAGKAGDRIFLLMMGCGFDGEVVRRVHQWRTGHIRSRHYVKPVLSTIRSYQYPELRVYWDASGPQAEQAGSPAGFRWLFAFNLPCYGGGMRIAPDADGTDGQLDVCGFHRGSLWHGLRYAMAVRRGKHAGLADCTLRRAARFRITSAVEVHYQLDGDPGGLLPVDVEVVPDRLTLLVPRQGGHARDCGRA